jgi:hypothetical protein
MNSSSILQHLVLHRAAIKCGSPEALSRMLNVPIEDLSRWTAVKAVAPDFIVEQAMDLLEGQPSA